MDNEYLDRVEAALSNASKQINKAIDSDDYEQVQKAIADAGDNVADAIDSSIHAKALLRVALRTQYCERPRGETSGSLPSLKTPRA